MRKMVVGLALVVLPIMAVSALAAEKGPKATCEDGEVLKYSTAVGDWVCADDNDTLGDLSCSDGQVATKQGEQWVCDDLPAELTDAQEDLCALYVLTGNVDSAPAYCPEICPCFSSQSLNNSGVEWEHCGYWEDPLGPEFGTVVSICDSDAWNGVDDCNTQEGTAKSFIRDVGAFYQRTCWMDGVQQPNIGVEYAESCNAILLAFIEQEGIECTSNDGNY